MAQPTAKGKDVGVEVAMPSTTCTEKKCPFHGTLKLHGRTFIGKVIRDIFHKTLTIEFQRTVPIRKYERSESRRSRIKAHAPSCMNIKKGDTVKIVETKPISKTKTFVAVEVIQQ